MYMYIQCHGDKKLVADLKYFSFATLIQGKIKTMTLFEIVTNCSSSGYQRKDPKTEELSCPVS